MKARQTLRHRRGNINDSTFNKKNENDEKKNRSKTGGQGFDYMVILVILLVFLLFMSAVKEIEEKPSISKDDTKDPKSIRGSIKKHKMAKEKITFDDYFEMVNMLSQGEEEVNFQPFIDHLHDMPGANKKTTNKDKNKKRRKKDTNKKERKNDIQSNSNNSLKCDKSNLGSILNDNYCDCPDGIDEPGTSACSHILVQKPIFECYNERKTIFVSQVGDGINDCKDGSDEIAII